MDSGATVDIMPSEYVPHVKAQPCTGIRKGRRLVAANQTPIVEKGEKRIQGVTDDGQDIDWKFIAGDVGKVLKSTATTCDEGNWVIFHKTGGWIVDVNTKKRTYFNRTGNTYAMDLWIRTPEDKEMNEQEVMNIQKESLHFSRQSTR